MKKIQKTFLPKNLVSITKEDDLQFISFQSLPFCPIREKKTNKYSFSKKGVSGIFIIKERNTNRIICVRSSQDCLYHQLRIVVSEKRLNGIHDLCVMPCDKELIEKTRKSILTLQRRTPLFNKDFEFFKENLLSGNPVDLSDIDFIPVYKTQEQIGRRATSILRSNIVDFGRRSGVYLFKENGVVVYVGKTVGYLYATVYSHMLKQYDDSEHHSRARYFETRNTHHYEVGIIEVSSYKRSHKSLAIAVGKLERMLIRQFNPRDNRNYTTSSDDEPIEWFDEGDFWKPPLTETNFLEDAPF